ALAALGEPQSISPPVLRVKSSGRSAMARADVPATVSGGRLRFEDVAEKWGLAFRYNAWPTGNLFLGDTMGGGVGLIDYDGDGWLDVYFVNGCKLPVDEKAPPAPNKLFRNRRDGTFEDVTAKAGVGGLGYGMGCAVGDYDNDGHDDLYVTGLGRAILYRNRGDGTFEDVTAKAGVGSNRWTTAAGFGDLDGDGDLDLAVVTYVQADPRTAPVCRDHDGRRMHCLPAYFPDQPDHLFRNNGDGTFTDVSRASGFEAPHGPGLGLAIADLDGDDRLDLFVGNDMAPCFLFRNLGGLRFEEVGVSAGVAYDGLGNTTASMGVVAADLDGDGLIDLFHTNFLEEPDTFLRNLGGGQFSDATASAGLDDPSRGVTGWGTAALDADNDGLIDLFVANGHLDQQPALNRPMAQPQHLFLGTSAGRFALAPATVSPYFARRVVSRGAAAGDLDNDGRVDRVDVHRDAPASLLRNTTGGGHWLGLRLTGGPKSGRTPVGARVTCRAGGRTAVRWLTTGTSYLSANDPRFWFGLGAAAKVDRLDVRWPSGAVQSWTDLPADRLLNLDEGGEPVAGPRSIK
ncbi:MAG TPA: CRTAC1 family protein, partial [Isosphaeraceae bacterium]|nr:CRTAC1 family protein [Isosphaeraceae bacterium]